MRWAVIAAAAAAASLGCGSASSASSENATAESATELSISYWASGKEKGSPKKWSLRCGPMGGNHPQVRTACTRLSGMKAPFAPVPSDAICTQVYGGPDQALVSGRYRGKRVRAVLSLSDGCQIARFKQLAFLVPGLRVTSAGVTR